MYNIFDDVKKIRKRLKLKFSIDPDKISGLSILLSFFVAYFILKNMFLFAALTIFIVLLLDILDGAIARGRKIESYQGQIVDWTADRLSEAIIFIPLFLADKLFLILFLLNMFLNFAVVNKRLVVLPVRHILLLWLIYMVIA